MSSNILNSPRFAALPAGPRGALQGETGPGRGLSLAWGPEGADPAAMGMGMCRRKLFRACISSWAFQNTAANISYIYSGLRFNLPFIHMLMRSSVLLSKSCCWSLPSPFFGRKALSGLRVAWAASLPNCQMWATPRVGASDPHLLMLHHRPQQHHSGLWGIQAAP